MLARTNGLAGRRRRCARGRATRCVFALFRGGGTCLCWNETCQRPKSKTGRGPTGLTICNLHPPRLERPPTLLAHALGFVVVAFSVPFKPSQLLLYSPRQANLVAHYLFPGTPLSHETNRCGKYAFSPLPRLHRPRHEALALAHPFHVV